MKKLILLATLFLAHAVFADPVLSCSNPATGAQFNLGVYADQPPNYYVNGPLLASLQAQGIYKPEEDDVGGTIQYGPNLTYSIQRNDGYNLSVYPKNGGWELFVTDQNGTKATFDFNSGECRNGGI